MVTEIIFKGFTIKVKDSDNFLKALESLCAKYSITSDDYYFMFGHD